MQSDEREKDSTHSTAAVTQDKVSDETSECVPKNSPAQREDVTSESYDVNHMNSSSNAVDQ